MKRIVTLFLSLFIFTSTTVLGNEGERLLQNPKLIKNVGLFCEGFKKVESGDLLHFRSFWLNNENNVEEFPLDEEDFDKDGIVFEHFFREPYHKPLTYDYDPLLLTIKYNDNIYYEVNRFTLLMEYYYWDDKTTYQCKTFSSKKKFLLEVKSIEKRYIDFFNERKI